MTELGTTLRLPVATVGAPLLPGAVVTLALDDTDSSPIGGAATDADPDPGTTLAAAVRAATAGDRRIVVRVPGSDIAVTARVPDTGSLPGGRPVAIVQIEQRATIGDTHRSASDTIYAEVMPLGEPRPTPRLEAKIRELRTVLGEIARLRNSRRLPELLEHVSDPGALADGVAMWADFDDDHKRAVLDAVDPAARVELIDAWAREHLAELRVAESIRSDVAEGVDKQHREYLLRQQLASIRKELGEEGDPSDDYRDKLAKLDLSDSVRTAITKELDRLERTNPQAPEHGWIVSWLDRMFELPWGHRSDDTVDLEAAQHILDDDHAGLDDVKERIIEYLAVRALAARRATEAATDAADSPDADEHPEGDNGSASAGHDDSRSRSGGDVRGHGAIMTLVGPPGVGKTSLGESIARAMGREFVRIALGGVRDEAEIRGHRRTYVGSRPGRIVRALSEAKTMNPVILLDEVDKLAAGGWSGDPAAALLEVLDPAQNHTFRDHYLEVDLDLSDVVFIATANVLETIPAPLLDRMDVVGLDGYTDDEKLHIAHRYLWPRQVRQAGLRPDEADVTDDAVLGVIRRYTREAGVRTLERELGRLAKKSAARVARGQETLVRIDDADLHDLLGRSRITDDVPERTQLPGVATGLAVTGAGGDVLHIETTAFATSADAEPTLTLTGQLGDVMKESAEIALNYVRSHADELGVDADALHRRFHVHVPAGAIPKDGPSAGITMTTALVSLLAGRPVADGVGMTGEITLQGAVLPIGGVKQKVLAAHRAGLTQVVLPKRNEPDLEDVPAHVLEQVAVHLADTYADVAAVAFGTTPAPEAAY